jgi:integrase
MDMAYLTGQRPADVLRITRADIKDGVLHIQQAKTDKKLRIAITGQLAVLMSRIAARRRGQAMQPLRLLVNESLEPLTQCALRSRFDRARSEAIKHHPDLATGIRNFQFRDLRAKAGTDKAESTGDIRRAQKQLGHATIAMTEHYVRDRKGDLTDPTK